RRVAIDLGRKPGVGASPAPSYGRSGAIPGPRKLVVYAPLSGDSDDSGDVTPKSSVFTLWLPATRPDRVGAGDVAQASCAYLSSTLAPAFSSVALIFSASSLETLSLTGLGAPSTRSLASLRPRPVSARTSLMTSIFLSPAAASTTVNSVFSSAGA